MQPYDFEDLRKRFVNMSELQVCQEFVSVRNQLTALKAMPDTDDFYLLWEQLSEAEYFLGIYLACLQCRSHGMELE